MKKENIQSRNRKLSAKARKKHSSFSSAAADMLKPLEKMYGSYAGMAAAASMGGMSQYYMAPPPPPHHQTSMTPPSMHSAAASSGSTAAAAAAAASQFGGVHMMSTAALGGFGAAGGCPPSFGGMVSEILSLNAHDMMAFGIMQVAIGREGLCA